tara:strand:+ start:1263 stop:2825 length:1563 start_codon:yes stop_codon:yes gene_type:complete
MTTKYGKKKILIVDFGSQVTRLIARRIRDFGVYSEIITPEDLGKIINFKDIHGLIFSGGPSTVTNKFFPKIPKRVFFLNIPILGICYGLQLIAKNFGGRIKSNTKKREYGRTLIKKRRNSVLTENFYKNRKSEVWMSHQDCVTKLPNNFYTVASSKSSKYAILEHKNKSIFGIQFHPEVSHTNRGIILLKNFVFKICNAKKNWGTLNYKKNIIENLRKISKSEKIICGLSGGVDSSVTALVLSKAVKKNLTCIIVDTGLMRKNEFKNLYKIFKNKYKINVKLVNESILFLTKLKNVTEPEKKRKIIGKLFVKIFERESKKIKGVKYLAQGTLYPDVIESKSVTGSGTSKIKSHHNVGGLPKKMNLKLVEPLKDLFKDEVRSLGSSLGLDKKILYRHPFPGPGLAIRILGKITPEKIRILREADNIFMNELKKYKLYHKIWQAYAALLPVKTVGVMGDTRTYEHTCLLRAVTSKDGMTADHFYFPKNFLDNISNKIINNVIGINRVVYDITSKPPGTIELE